MTRRNSKQNDSTNRGHFKEDTFAEKPQTDKTHCRQNRIVGETVFQNSSSGEKAPGLSNGVR